MLLFHWLEQLAVRFHSFTLRSRAKHLRRHSRIRRPLDVATERLEDRTLLTTLVEINSGTLTITDDAGGNSNDDLTISHSGGTYTIVDNGGLTIDVSSIFGATGSGTSTVTVPDAGVTGIEFALLGGNDTVAVTSVQTGLTGGLTVNGGDGDNTLTFTGVTVEGNVNIITEDGVDDVLLDGLTVTGNLSVSLGGGDDTLFINHDAATSLYSGIADLDLGDDNDSMRIDSAIGGEVTFESDLTIDLGEGDQTLNLFNERFVVEGNFTLRAGSGNNITPLANSIRPSVVGDVSFLFGDGDNRINYAGSVGGRLIYRAGNGNNDIVLTETIASGGQTEYVVDIRTGSGDDTFTLAGTTGAVISGCVLLDGGTNVFDQSNWTLDSDWTLVTSGPANMPEISLAGDTLVVEDAVASDSSLSIQSDTTNSQFVIHDPNNMLCTIVPGSTGSGTNTVTIPFGAITNILINTLDGDDELTVDLSLGNFAVPIEYNGGTQSTAAGDTLNITGGTVTTAVFNYTNANDGDISLDGNTITYTGLEPIDSSVNADNLIFTFNGGNEVIDVTNSGTAGRTTINSNLGEMTTFDNPGESLTINAGSGDDGINVLSFGSGYDAALTINGGGEDDTVNVNTSLTLGSAAPGNTGNLTINASEITVGLSAAINTAAATANGQPGNVTFNASDNIALFFNTSITTDDGTINFDAAGGPGASSAIDINGDLTTTGTGDITLSANSSGTAAGDFIGVNINNTQVSATGSGSVMISGQGGDASTDEQIGVLVRSGGGISSGSGSITIDGQGGGSGSGNRNYGFRLHQVGSMLTTTGGSVSITGEGGSTTGSNNKGILIDVLTSIGVGGTGALELIGTGGSGTHQNAGVEMLADSVVTVADGNLDITGIGNNAPDVIFDDGSTASTAGDVTVTGNGTEFIATAAGVASMTHIAGNIVTLNGVVAPGGSPGQLLVTGAFTLSATDTLEVELDGNTPGTEFDQVVVTGTVELGEADLLIDRDAGFMPNPGDEFIIIDNDGTVDPVMGTFSQSIIRVDGTNYAVIYDGGDGNDVVLRVLATPATNLEVDNLDDEVDGDFSDGELTLREAILLANLEADLNTITFDPNLFTGGQQDIDMQPQPTGNFRMEILEDVDIVGPGADLLTIDADFLSQIFFINSATVSISDVTLEDGSANGLDDGFFIEDPGPPFPVLLSNAERGGAIFNQEGDLTLINVVAVDNEAIDSGGAIYNLGTLTVIDSEFRTNLSGDDGGAIYNATTFNVTATLNVSGTLFVANDASSDDGGGIHNSGGDITVDTSSFIDNFANFAGGGLSTVGGSAFVSNSTFGGNRAFVIGGAIAHDDSDLVLVNVTISSNQASADGGGVFHNDGDLTIVNSTIYGNRADDDGDGGGNETGGGIWTFDDASTNTTLVNSIVVGNMVGAVGSGMPDDINEKDLEASSANNIIGDAATSGGLLDGIDGNIVGVNAIDVIDTNLQNNGGPTSTHALFLGSPAIDAGDTDRATDDGTNLGTALVFDQRGMGFDREIGNAVDIGAVELQTFAEVTIADASVSEGDTGTTTITFTLTRSANTVGTTSVDFAITNDTTETDDFNGGTLPSGTVTFADGEITTTITVLIAGETTVESDETFLVTLSNPTLGSTITDDMATGTITNDDAATLSIDDVSQDENAGTMTFTVSLSREVDTDVTVDFATATDTADASDFTGNTGTATITAGTTSTTITVDISADDIVELDEQFLVNLTSLAAGGRNVTIADAQGIGTIQNDDAAELSIDDVSQDENAGTMTFTVSLSQEVDTGVTVDFATATDTADASDFTGNTGTATIAAGMTSTTITVDIFADDIVELDEQFLVNLSNLQASGRSVTLTDDQSVGTIINDDAATVLIDDVSQDEDAGTMTFTVSLSQEVDTDLSIEFATTANTAETDDFIDTSGTLTITTGNTSATVTVDVNADDIVELDEQFLVDLSNLAAGGRAVTLADSQALGTIKNDDATSLSIGDVAVLERTAESQFVSFIVTLDNEVDTSVTVDFATADGTATIANNDYTATSGMLDFTGMAGETRTLSVEVFGDINFEDDEMFLVNLSNVQASGRNVILADDSATGTITNDDLIADLAMFDDQPVMPDLINGDFEVVVSGNFDDMPTAREVREDLFFWNPTTGANRIIFSDGTLQDSPIAPTAINGGDFTDVLMGDFDENGSSNLFFWNPATGQNRLVHITGNTGSVGTSFETNVVASTVINGNDFPAAVVGNFDGAGPDDIFFWNPTSGRNRIVHFETVAAGSNTDLNNFQTNVVDTTAINGNDFQEVHVGQLIDGGLDELLFLNLNTGANRRVEFSAVMPGVESEVESLETGSMGSQIGFNGFEDRLVQIVDLNGDGLDDVFLWNPTTGANRTALTDIRDQASPHFVDDVVTPTLINGNSFSRLARLVDSAFTPGEGEDLYFWDPITGANRTITN
ncbi:Calx-beta domain-containing protein [Thalassoroseus pseudoceratinae]|uniref:Calx-beta domain-containing protein n=1 Tax=Thalassoroseus pseudoceratinae TaxID=2713176 RepID=UPI00141DE9BF|nr:Calx-beta domain-containing protein [Thalassoroseus pseudoceratinae]